MDMDDPSLSFHVPSDNRKAWGTCIVCGTTLDRASMVVFRARYKLKWIRALARNKQEYAELERRFGNPRQKMLCRNHFKETDFGPDNQLIRGRCPSKLRCWDDASSKYDEEIDCKNETIDEPISVETATTSQGDQSAVKTSIKKENDAVNSLPAEPTSPSLDTTPDFEPSFLKKFRCFICDESRYEEGYARRISKKKENHAVLCAGAVCLGFFTVEQARKAFQLLEAKHCYEHVRDVMVILLLRINAGAYKCIRQLITSITKDIISVALPTESELTRYAEGELGIVVTAHPVLHKLSDEVRESLLVNTRSGAVNSKLPPINLLEFEDCIAEVLYRWQMGYVQKFELKENLASSGIQLAAICGIDSMKSKEVPGSEELFSDVKDESIGAGTSGIPISALLSSASTVTEVKQEKQDSSIPTLEKANGVKETENGLNSDKEKPTSSKENPVNGMERVKETGLSTSTFLATDNKRIQRSDYPTLRFVNAKSECLMCGKVRDRSEFVSFSTIRATALAWVQNFADSDAEVNQLIDKIDRTYPYNRVLCRYHFVPSAFTQTKGGAFRLNGTAAPSKKCHIEEIEIKEENGECDCKSKAKQKDGKCGVTEGNKFVPCRKSTCPCCSYWMNLKNDCSS